MSLKLESLNYLCRVYQFNSIKLAAESVPVAPSTISAAIHKLEKEWGIPLLIRTYRGIELTEEGKKIAMASEKLFNEVDNIETLIKIETSKRKRLSAENEKLTLLMSRGWWQGKTAEILPHLLNRGIQVEIPDLAYNNEKCLSLVDQNQTTVLLSYFMEPLKEKVADYSHVRFIKIRSGKPCILLRKDSKWASPEKISFLPKEAVRLPFLRFTEGYDQTFDILEILEDYGKINIVANISNISVLIAMLKADLGVAVGCEEKILERDKDLRFIPIKTEKRFSFSMCYNENIPEGYLVILQNMLKDCFQ